MSEGLPETKKDSKYYKGLSKQKAAGRKRHLQDCTSSRKLRRATDRESSLPSLPPVPVCVYASTTTSSVAGATCATGTHASTTPDTSGRGYKCSKASGKTTAVHRAGDGTYLYDVHKTTGGRTRYLVREVD